MDKARIRVLLPEKAPAGLVEWTRSKHGRSELGGEFCVFHSERMSMEPTLQEIMEYNSLAPRRKEWAAVCTCSACGEDFVTQKEPGMSAIRLVTGEDGWTYTLNIGEPVDPYMGIEVNREGDSLNCPMCGSEIRLIHAKHLRGGRMKQLMVASVQNVEGYTAVIYWLVYRIISEFGYSEYGANPAEAYVLTETGALVRYTHQNRSGGFGNCNRQLTAWKLCSNNEDIIDKTYHDWESINNKKAGADIYDVYPDLEKTTGEKTALIEFLEAGGYRPVAYLKWWRTQRNIENLCRQGQASMVAAIMGDSYRFSYDLKREAEKYLDLSKNKPHEMMRMSKADFRWIRDTGTQLTPDSIQKWNRYREASGKLDLVEFTKYCREFGNSGMNAALSILREYGDADIDKIYRYMTRNDRHPRETGILLDTRSCMRKLYNRPLTGEELWPKHLHETHDRVTQMWAEENNRRRKEEMLTGFQRVIDQYGHLEWTDGDLCVILPRSSADLVQEGKVLRHCVGGYSEPHVKGSSVIFFIRRYRRPERSYYTLAINMTGKPKESQLHGYGNERHGDHKQYTHKIPHKVRAFCDRWENEILLPWYAEQQRKMKEEKSA
jgi:hypothetical protein